MACSPRNPISERYTAQDLTPEALRAYRDALEHADRSPATIAKHLSAIRGLAAAVGDLTPQAVRAYRDALEHADRSPATIAKHLSAIRGLAAAAGADADIRTVKSASVARGERAPCHTRSSRAC